MEATEFHWDAVRTAVALAAFRAAESARPPRCFGVADEPLSSDAKTMPIYVMGEGYATGIENVNTAEEHILHGIYDLQGRKLSQEPESGIYIKDGKKYVK